MDGGDVAVAQEHRPAGLRAMALRPAAMFLGYVRRRNGRRRCRRSPRNIATSGRRRILGYVRAAKWTGYSTSGGEMDGGDIAAAQEHRPAGLRAMALRPAAMFLGYVRAAKWTAATSP